MYVLRNVSDDVISILIAIFFFRQSQISNTDQGRIDNENHIKRSL